VFYFMVTTNAVYAAYYCTFSFHDHTIKVF
jgi:hypothetical protein